jgi:iron(III) transport system ATP-binding protein
MVADFVGLVNFIPAEVRSDGNVYLENTDIQFPNDNNLSGKVTLAVRPENIVLSKDRGRIEGVLDHHFYLGDSIDYRIKVKDHFVRVIVKGAEVGTFRDGDKVLLDFHKVLTFPAQ